MKEIHVRSRMLTQTCALALAACSAEVNGEVDGESVGALISVFFTEDEDDLGADTLTSVSGVGTTLFDGCSLLAKRQENANELRETLLDDLEDAAGDQNDIEDAFDAFATGIVEYDEANLPTDYWVVVVGVSALDEDDIDGGEAKIDVEDPDVDADVQGGITVCRINDHPRTDEDENDIAIVREDADCYAALEGDIEVVKYDSESAFEVKATAVLADVRDLGDENPDDAGEVEITISASHCPKLQDAIDDAEKIEEDAAAGP